MLRVSRVEESDADSDARVLHYLAHRPDRSLLIAGDLTVPLRQHTGIWIAESDSEIEGAMALFRGFEIPVAAMTAATLEAGRSLISFLPSPSDRSLVVVLNSEEPLAQHLGSPIGRDPWMTRATARISCPKAVSPILASQVEELRLFYSRLEMKFWNPLMLQYGHYYGIRSADGQLASVAGVNFVITSQEYAQIGNVATLPEFRNKGMASACTSVVVNSLAESGIKECGLFADNGDSALVRLYERLGFREKGQFLFFSLTREI